MKSVPSLSVLLLCWNHADFLETCIRALAEQTERDFETIFLDNNSTDGSFEIAVELFAKYSIQATFIKNSAAKGISSNLNDLLAAATGELICPISTDDWYLPSFVEVAQREARKSPSVAWFFGLRSGYSVERGVFLESHPYIDGDVREAFLRGRFDVNLNGAVYRRQAIDALGGWDNRLKLEDIDMAFRLSEYGPCKKIDAPLVVYRFHPGGVSRNTDFMLDALKQFYDKHANSFPRRGRLALSDTIRQMAARAIELDDKTLALRLLVKSFRTYPLNLQVPRTLFYLLRRSVRDFSSGRS